MLQQFLQSLVPAMSQAAGNKTTEDQKRPCRLDKEHNPYTAGNAFIKGLCISCVVIALVNIAFITITPQYYRDESTLLIPFIFGMCLWLLYFSIVNLRERYTLTADSLVVRRFFTRRYSYDSLKKGIHIKPPKISKQQSIKLHLYPKGHIKLKLLYKKSSFTFVLALENRTGLYLYNDFAGVTEHTLHDLYGGKNEKYI